LIRNPVLVQRRKDLGGAVKTRKRKAHDANVAGGVGAVHDKRR
jgi:hypothetical protein